MAAAGRATRLIDLGMSLGFVSERIVLPVVFGVVTVGTLALSLVGGWFGLDTRIYRGAALAMLDGRDPWLATVDRVRFAGPPPTLLGYVPAALVPENVAVIAYCVTSVAAAIILVRALRLPWWWLLFPPLSDSIIVGNPDAIAAMLVVCGGRFAGLGVVLKVYTAVPLLIQRRWAALAVAAGVSAVTLPLWPTFFADAAVISNTFEVWADGRLSAWGTPMLLPTALAILVLIVRRRGGEWVAVPALWPHTQLHYACVALPALRGRPLVALAMSVGFVQLTPIAIIAQVVWEEWRLRARAGVPDAAPSRSTAVEPAWN